ncbi:testis-expressed protein 36 [Megalops cyprinoides]|uniref:testis-expressed protein 36 n=1 Tax=Megalops cyprinoides TaxID=118141 RepID=UPI001864FE2D|nr:testis-expressed protein 36 [Megalops cyprinoides]
MSDHLSNRITQERSSFVDNDVKRKRGCREYPFSTHDNRTSLQNSIEAYDQGLGRRKFAGETRQHNSHFCLRDDGNSSEAGGWSEDSSAYQTDYQGCQGTEGTHSRRFPRNHLERSHAAVAKAGEGGMWFGRHDAKHCTPLSVLAATNCSCKIGVTPQLYPVL